MVIFTEKYVKAGPVARKRFDCSGGFDCSDGSRRRLTGPPERSGSDVTMYGHRNTSPEAAGDGERPETAEHPATARKEW